MQPAIETVGLRRVFGTVVAPGTFFGFLVEALVVRV